MKRALIALLMSLLMLASLFPVEAMAAELGEDTENTETIVETVSLPELEEQPALTATEIETVEEPVIEEPVAEDPVIMEPAVEESVTEEPEAGEPAAEVLSFDMIESELQEGEDIVIAEDTPEETAEGSEEEQLAEEIQEIEPILADPVENSLTLEAADAGTDGIAIDEAHFPDPIFRSYVAKNCDTDQDGKLSADEINAVIDIDVNSLGIHDLTGIQLFTNLTELACDSNQLTSLDVSGCTMLTWLSCFENQLTSLDVSANTSLTILDCGTNQLTSLDVRANTALTRLYCGTNQLTSLDVTHCKALTDLGCADDQLTALDVSANTAMERLWCDGNQLTSLDLRANTALEELWCDRNQLTSLDLRANTSLTVLYCNQSAASEMTETNGTYQLDLAALVGAENVDRITVTSVTPSNTQCSVSNGVLTSQTALTGLTYTYAHGGPDNGVMPVTLTLTSEGAPVPGQAHTIDDLPTEPVFDPNPNYDIWTVVEYTIEDIQADLVCTVSAKADFSEFYLECEFYGDDQMTRTVYDGSEYTVLEDKTGFMAFDTPAILDIAMEQGLWFRIKENDDRQEHVVGLENGLVTMYTNGEIDTAYTGLANYEDTWYYLTNGVQNNDFFGFTEFAGGKFLVANGTVATHINGLFQDPNDTAVWYFLSNGQAQTQYSGLALYDGSWFYLKDGILDTTFSGVVNYDGGKFLVGAGRIMSEVCGLCQDPITGTWYFFADGMVQDYTGQVEYGGATFHITHGVLDA